MANKNVEHNEDNFESIESTLSGAEQFIEKNQKVLIMAVLGILAVVGIYVAYQKWYSGPREIEAHEQMYVAEDYFQRDSFALAINGDGNYPGFLQVIDDYGSTKAGNLAKYYTGVSYYKLADYDKAIEYLESFKGKDKIVGPVAKGCIGDAYSQKGEVEKAAKLYEEAASMNDNNYTTPIFLMKAGKAYESMNNWKSALEVYEKIKKNYLETQEGRSIDKYITRAKLKL